MARGHGFSARNGENQPLGEFTQTGKFGRLFPRLPAFTPSAQKLTELGEAMIDPNPELPEGDNNQVPAGYIYLGQFIDSQKYTKHSGAKFFSCEKFVTRS